MPNTLDEAIKIIGPTHFLSGSRVTVDPPVLDTDIDVVFIYDGATSRRLQEIGFVITPHEEYPNEQIKAVYRKNDINLIAVAEQADYDRWECATRLATLMNLKEKAQRVALFQFITEGVVRDHPAIKLLPGPFIEVTDAQLTKQPGFLEFPF